jgi:hypothetical protein
MEEKHAERLDSDVTQAFKAALSDDLESIKSEAANDLSDSDDDLYSAPPRRHTVLGSGPERQLSHSPASHYEYINPTAEEQESVVSRESFASRRLHPSRRRARSISPPSHRDISPPRRRSPSGWPQYPRHGPIHLPDDRPDNTFISPPRTSTHGPQPPYGWSRPYDFGSLQVGHDATPMPSCQFDNRLNMANTTNPQMGPQKLPSCVATNVNPGRGPAPKTQRRSLNPSYRGDSNDRPALINGNGSPQVGFPTNSSSQYEKAPLKAKHMGIHHNSCGPRGPQVFPPSAKSNFEKRAKHFASDDSSDDEGTVLLDPATWKYQPLPRGPLGDYATKPIPPAFHKSATSSDDSPVFHRLPSRPYSVVGAVQPSSALKRSNTTVRNDNVTWQGNLARAKSVNFSTTDTSIPSRTAWPAERPAPPPRKPIDSRSTVPEMARFPPLSQIESDIPGHPSSRHPGVPGQHHAWQSGNDRIYGANAPFPPRPSMTTLTPQNVDAATDSQSQRSNNPFHRPFPPQVTHRVSHQSLDNTRSASETQEKPKGLRPSQSVPVFKVAPARPARLSPAEPGARLAGPFDPLADAAGLKVILPSQPSSAKPKEDGQGNINNPGNLHRASTVSGYYPPRYAGGRQPGQLSHHQSLRNLSQRPRFGAGQPLESMSAPNDDFTLYSSSSSFSEQVNSIPINSTARRVMPKPPIYGYPAGGQARQHYHRSHVQSNTPERVSMEATRDHSASTPAPAEEDLLDYYESTAGPSRKAVRLTEDTVSSSSAAAQTEREVTVTHHDNESVNAISECVEILKTLGFGSARNGGAERLIVYAQAAGGVLEDALEIIEEDQKAYKDRDWSADT